MTNKERTENKKPEKKRRKKNGKMVNTNRGEVAYLTGADAILPGQFALLGDRYGLLSVFFFVGSLIHWRRIWSACYIRALTIHMMRSLS